MFSSRGRRDGRSISQKFVNGDLVLRHTHSSTIIHFSISRCIHQDFFQDYSLREETKFNSILVKSNLRRVTHTQRHKHTVYLLITLRRHMMSSSISYQQFSFKLSLQKVSKLRLRRHEMTQKKFKDKGINTLPLQLYQMTFSTDIST